METAATILIILLSSVLIIFLIFCIVLTAGIVKLTRTVQHIADRADHAIDNVEAMTETFKNAAGPLAAGKVIMNIVNMMSKGKKGK